MYLWSGVGATAISAATLVFLSRIFKLTPALAPLYAFRRLAGTPALHHGILIYVALAAYSLAMLAIRNIVLSRLGETGAGWFQAAVGMVLTLSAAITLASGVYLIPLLNRDLDPLNKAKTTHRFAQFALAAMAFMALPIVQFPQLFLHLLYAPGFLPLAPWLVWFVVWQLAAQWANIYQQLLIGLHDVSFVTLTTITGYAMSAGLVWWLAPRHGLCGVAAGLVAGAMCMGAASVWRLNRRHRSPVAIHELRLVFLIVMLMALQGATLDPTAGFTRAGLAWRICYALLTLGSLLMFLPKELWRPKAPAT